MALINGRQSMTVVITGRNDGYYVKPDIYYKINKYIESLNRSFGRIEKDIIFVEYNNPENEPHLFEKVRGNKIRWIVVPPSFHKTVTNLDYMSFCEFFAKNIGMRRTSVDCDFILVGNPDIIFRDGFARTLEKRNLYLGAKWHMLKGMNACRDKKDASVHGALGDFMIFDRESCFELRGFRQAVIWGGMDTRFAYDWVASKRKVIEMSNFILLHEDHDKDSQSLFDQRRKREDNRARGVLDNPPENSQDWGFPQVDFQEVIE
jgi:hypothetical protein